MERFMATINVSATIYSAEHSIISFVRYDGNGECYGVDDRIVKFFRDLFEQAKAKYIEDMARFRDVSNDPLLKQWRDEELALEIRERAELKRLKEKYEGSNLRATIIPDCMAHYQR